MKIERSLGSSKGVGVGRSEAHFMKNNGTMTFEVLSPGQVQGN